MSWQISRALSCGANNQRFMVPVMEHFGRGWSYDDKV